MLHIRPGPAPGFLFARSRHKCAGTLATPCGRMGRIYDLTEKYTVLVERIRSYPMTEWARERILAEVDRIWRSEMRRRSDDGGESILALQSWAASRW